ncbi:hypothetical protein ACJX0J_001186 (mitochondrion) [Zea mays]
MYAASPHVVGRSKEESVVAIRIALHAILRVIVLALLTSFSAEQDNTTRAIHIPIPLVADSQPTMTAYDNKTHKKTRITNSTDMKRRNRILANMNYIWSDTTNFLEKLPSTTGGFLAESSDIRNKGTERVDMGLFLIKAYIGGGDSRRSIALFTSEWYEVGLIWKHWAIYFIPTIPLKGFIGGAGEEQSLVVSEWHSFEFERINVSKRMRTSQIVIVQYERWWCLDARKNGRGR